jgi:hypothetical protein
MNLLAVLTLYTFVVVFGLYYSLSRLINERFEWLEEHMWDPIEEE